jgi:hypothetical protein
MECLEQVKEKKDGVEIDRQIKKIRSGARHRTT